MSRAAPRPAPLDALGARTAPPGVGGGEARRQDGGGGGLCVSLPRPSRPRAGGGPRAAPRRAEPACARPTRGGCCGCRWRRFARRWVGIQCRFRPATSSPTCCSGTCRGWAGAATATASSVSAGRAGVCGAVLWGEGLLAEDVVVAVAVWTRSWEAGCGWPCLSRGLDQATSVSRSQPRPFCEGRLG